MKQTIILLVLLAAIHSGVHSQTDSASATTELQLTVPAPTPPYFHRPFLATVTTLDGTVRKGWIYKVNADQIVFVPGGKNAVKGWSAPSFAPGNSFAIASENVKTITGHRKNAGLNGALIGFGVGALTGIVIGLAEGDDEVYNGPISDPLTGIVIALSNAFAMTAGEKALTYGLTLGTGGGILGLVLSSVARKKFIIGGKKEKVRDLQAELMRKLAIH